MVVGVKISPMIVVSSPLGFHVFADPNMVFSQIGNIPIEDLTLSLKLKAVFPFENASHAATIWNAIEHQCIVIC
jgi:hypothetical protein